MEATEGVFSLRGIPKQKHNTHRYMKKFLYSALLLALATSSFAQKESKAQSAQKINDRAVALWMNNLSNKDSVAAASHLLDQALALDPTCVAAYSNKANILQSNGKDGELMKLFDRGIKHNPQVYTFPMYKALLMEKMGKSASVRPLYQKALQLCQTRLAEKTDVTLFLNSLFLKYCLDGVDVTWEQVKASLPSSFTEAQKQEVKASMEQLGSFKQLKERMTRGEHALLSTPQRGKGLPTMREDGAYYIVDELAEFPGGANALRLFLATHLKNLPNSVGKQLLVNFVVDSDGSVRDAVIKKSADPEADAEALRVLALMPKWQPAKVKGMSVPMVYNIPITLK